MDDVQQMASAEQITAVVHGFVKVWTKFEAMLHDELAKTRGCSSEILSGSEAHFNTFYRVGTCIYSENSLTMGELSRALSVPVSTATRMVDGLVARGCVQRLLDPADRRVVRVALTESSREFYEATEKYIGEHVRQILSCLTDEEQAVLFGLIRKVVAALEEAER